MKKLFLLITIIIFASGLVFSQTITVNSPHSGDTVYKGNSCTINWTKAGTQHARVKIRLFDKTGVTKILEITNDTLNDGAFSWPVPVSVPNGSYVIRVKTVDDEVQDDSNMFSIAIYTSASINVTSPNGGEEWTRYKNYNITWVSSGISSSEHVKIFLYKDPDIKIGLIKVVQNSGSYQWKIVPGIMMPVTPDSGYKIKIVSKNDPSISDYSNASFRIIKEPVTGTIKVIRPRKGALIEGITYPIKWEKTGFFKHDYVVIDFYKWIKGNWNAPSHYEFIKRITSSACGNSFGWKVPNGLIAGPSVNYCVKVSVLAPYSMNPESVAYSENFWIGSMKPDLLFERIKKSFRPINNETIEVTFGVGVGNMGIKESVLCNGRLTIIGSNGQRVQSIPVCNFEIRPVVYGGNKNIKVKVRIPNSTRQYRYKIELDTNNVNHEGNEDNNIKWGTVSWNPNN